MKRRLQHACANPIGASVVCTECGNMGYKGACNFCKRPGTVSTVALPYAFKLLIQEMLGMGIAVRLVLNKPNR